MSKTRKLGDDKSKNKRTRAATTPEQFREEMLELGKSFGGDREDVHFEQDRAMCRMLAELGYGAGVDIFLKQDKWYS